MATWVGTFGSRCKRAWGDSLTTSTWTDDNGVANATQGTAARRPTVITTTCGIHNAAAFSSNGSFSTNADVMVASAGGTSATPSQTMVGGVCRVTAGFSTDGNGAGLIQIGADRLAVYIYPAIDNMLRLAGWGNVGFAWSDNAINTNTWTPFVGTWNDSTDTIRLYVNRALQSGFTASSDNAGINLGTETICLGAGTTGAIAPFMGDLGCVGICQDSTAFSAADISAAFDILEDWIDGQRLDPCGRSGFFGM